ncbi:MAG TPA: DUF952 domain-containing protein, partial [Bacteroidota bacterium]|nr:DUF952 domain-containing protein [Bacteroidota bacterium]
YAQVEEKLILLKIDPQKLHSETKYESAVPEAAAGSEHLKTSTMFPHVYGPIDQIAIEGIGILAKENNGYRWPIEFVPLSEYLH